MALLIVALLIMALLIMASLTVELQIMALQIIALNFDKDYATRGINLSKKFNEFDTCGQFHKAFLSVIYTVISI